jgi:transcriptional regulator with XRE-family HTH domain
MKIRRFGEKLRALRERHRISPVDLAHAFGYTSTSQIYYLETSKRSPTGDLILKVSKFFGVSADVLIDDALELDA